MSEKKGKARGLGRGLSALMADVEPARDASGEAAPRRPDTIVPIEQVAPNPDQPRRHFAEADLQELAESVRARGILQPLIVRPDPRDPGAFQIVAGERRWRAAQLAQLHEIPVLVRDFDDTEVLEVAIVENIQRADLNPLEEAAGYRQLMDRFGHTQEKLAQALGKSRSHIANLLRLLNLPDEVQGMVREGSLSAGHARALVATDMPVEIARQVAAKGLSVRETEKLVKKSAQEPRSPRAPRQSGGEKDADTRALEGDLHAALGMGVSIEHDPGTNGGRIVIRYHSLEQLDTLCNLLSRN